MGRFWETVGVAIVGVVLALDVVDRLFGQKEPRRDTSVKEPRHDSSRSRDVRPVQAVPQHQSGVAYRQSSEWYSRPTPQALPGQRRSGYEPESQQPHQHISSFAPQTSVPTQRRTGYEPEIPRGWLPTRRLSDDTPPALYDPELEESRDDIPLSGDEHRAMADKSYKEMTKAFEQSKLLKRTGFWAEAQSMEEKGQKFKRTMETLNQKASDLIFEENNKNKKPGEVDLHRLFLKEAEQKVQEAIWAAEARGASSVRFIVGQGKHSKNGARLKPELTSFIEGLGHTVRTDGRNAGVLVVEV